MRLLHTRTLRFKEFYDDDIPKYAILSHRWGDDEVTFRDMQYLDAEKIGNMSNRRYRKFKKLNKFCRKARQRQHEWAWIDTCCIDKSSSAELSEAINSMYSWYQNARECFVYLSDVTLSKEDERAILADGRDDPDTDNTKGWYRGCSPGLKQQFGNSSWFYRGWTLQELLAPKSVFFYDSSWQYFGKKNLLAQEILEITGIPLHYTIADGPYYSVRSASVAQRMSWAAFRKTTRIEDSAYCLLGLFDVNMPLLYGEGKKAFMRLQIEILKINDDESIFAWAVPTNYEDRFQVLASNAKYFMDSGSIRSYDYAQAWRKPLVMTNKGIEMSVPMKYLEKSCYTIAGQELYVFPLACRINEHSDEAIKMYVTTALGDGFFRYTPDDHDLQRMPKNIRPCKLKDLEKELQGLCKTVYLTQ